MVCSPGTTLHSVCGQGGLAEPAAFFWICSATRLAVPRLLTVCHFSKQHAALTMDGGLLQILTHWALKATPVGILLSPHFIDGTTENYSMKQTALSGTSLGRAVQGGRDPGRQSAEYCSHLRPVPSGHLP